jgi:hypothetical protein
MDSFATVAGTTAHQHHNQQHRSSLSTQTQLQSQSQSESKLTTTTTTTVSYGEASVGEKRPRIITKLVDQFVDASNASRIAFVCEFSQGGEHSTIEWYHNEVLVEIRGNENKFLVQNEVNRSTLYILNVNFEDSGYYSFKIQNKYGFDVSSANLTIFQSNFFLLTSIFVETST